VSLYNWHENQSNIIPPDSEDAAASLAGTWDQETADLQAQFGANTVQYTYNVDTFGPPGLLTSVSLARHHIAPPLTVDVDIINGQLLPINDTKELASVRSPLTPAQIIHYDKLTGELSGLYNSLSHDGNALQALDKLILEIIDMSTEILPENSRVDVLVVPSGGKYHCPFAGCRKKDAGWALSRDARDHIWIHHLSRRLTCPWNDWCASPS
jgi:hypothetical protein